MSWKDYLLVSGGVYGLWMGHKIGVGSKISAVAGMVIPGFRKLKWAVGRAEVVSQPAASNHLRLESRKDGSEEVSLTAPRYQVIVCEKKDGRLVKLGCAVRFDGNFLVGPDHVLGEADLPKYAVGRQKFVCLDKKERIPLDTDLVAIRMSPSELSTIGVSVAKIGLVSAKGVYSQIVGVDSKGTTGVLKMDRVAFGRTVYDGTTLPGYSGAAYTSGAFCSAIHQSGGAVNGGYASSYIWMLLKDHLRVEDVVEPESKKNWNSDTPEWLLSQFKAGKKLKWKRTGDPDLIELMLDDGKFSRVSPASMHKAFGPTWHDHDVIEKGFDRSYRDVPRESILESVPCTSGSGEDHGSKLPGALSLLEPDQAWARLSLQQEMREFFNLSKRQQEDIRKCSQRQMSQNLASSGQAKTMATKNS
ncbi:hypothetical protein 1 [Hubei sobemo-like virus 48]|uniref:hypothetical protein 1 n=1 Tax=Hubei sobemo-like virus 48 TaxID=1923236 RepID=UPI00090BA421|nr:hypothetical protein 1 [Hubei sobemo-like virus 48]APG75765.1 hypothetical protein 1 [Hubei sobemo-like virus 48]